VSILEPRARSTLATNRNSVPWITIPLDSSRQGSEPLDKAPKTFYDQPPEMTNVDLRSPALIQRQETLIAQMEREPTPRVVGIQSPSTPESALPKSAIDCSQRPMRHLLEAAASPVFRALLREVGAANSLPGGVESRDSLRAARDVIIDANKRPPEDLETYLCYLRSIADSLQPVLQAACTSRSLSERLPGLQPLQEEVLRSLVAYHDGQIDAICRDGEGADRQQMFQDWWTDLLNYGGRQGDLDTPAKFVGLWAKTTDRTRVLNDLLEYARNTCVCPYRDGSEALSRVQGLADRGTAAQFGINSATRKIAEILRDFVIDFVPEGPNAGRAS
jgi:hypothetical protein